MRKFLPILILLDTNQPIKPIPITTLAQTEQYSSFHESCHESYVHFTILRKLRNRPLQFDANSWRRLWR